MLGHVERGHLERVGLNLERPLAAEEGFARERVNLRDLLVRHGVAAGRRAVAMDHEKGPGASVRSIVSIREAGVDREVVVGIRVHQAGSDGVEAFRRLAVALLDLGTEFARPAADRIGVEEGKAPAPVLLPDLQFGFLFEYPHQDRRFFRHVLAFDFALHPVGKGLHVAAVDRGGRAVGVATGQR